MSRNRIKFYSEDRLPLEPNVQGMILDNGEYGDVLNWYSNYIKDSDTAKKYLKDFFAENEGLNPKFVEILPILPKQWVNRTAGWIARIMSNGGAIPDSGVEFFMKKVDEMISHVDSIVDETSEKEVVSPSVNIQNKVSKLIAELEVLIDNGTITPLWDFAEWCSSKGVAPNIAKKISEHFQPVLSELFAAINGDEDVVEGYEKYTEDELLYKAGIYNQLVSGADAVKKIPVQRVAVPAHKVFEFFRYAEESKSLQIKSVRPKDILGARELWVYTQKYKTLTVFRSLDRSGLGVHRTAIDKYDPDNSFTIRIGRKTDTYLKAVLGLSREDLEELITKDDDDNTPFTPRIHETTLLLRIFR